MKDTIWLVANRRGVVRMLKRWPSLDEGEVAMKLRVEVSDASYARPFAEATIVVDDEHVLRPAATVTVQPPGDPAAAQAQDQPGDPAEGPAG